MVKISSALFIQHDWNKKLKAELNEYKQSHYEYDYEYEHKYESDDNISIPSIDETTFNDDIMTENESKHYLQVEDILSKNKKLRDKLG